ncbi:hypothetical protein NG798_22025 [Ancylothrix sp. C2]|uniref:hypothetical protein n=1 Tax=Ancylothrix sp. D3o TaxID=2953691 RepID=UPI0021BB410F|nr:hypothetical protein [Ancylothrix sp. D3o]MCT7952476.1 hypothetical protein [Ancylothrix sp. D3o]
MTKLPSKLIVTRVFALMFLVLLSACTAIGPGPSRSVVQEALRIQISQTQAQLAPQLNLSSRPELEITRVTISAEKPLLIEDLQGFKVQGFYDLTVTFPNQVIKQNKKFFELYLQRQKRAQTWRLARPLKEAGEQTEKWATYAI